MAYDWYKLFNKSEFEAENIPARTLLVQLDDRGVETFEIFRGNYVAVMYGDAFLPINFLDQNPYAQNGYAVYRDPNDDVWFGFEVEE